MGHFRLDSKIRPQNVQFHDSFWREQTLAATKLFLSLTRIDFAVGVSSRAVRVFQALSLRRVRPSYGTFSLMVFQRNYVRGPYRSYDKYIYYMASSASRQDDPNCAMWLATWAGKMESSCPLGTTCCILQEKFPWKPYNNSLFTKFVQLRWLDIGLLLFLWVYTPRLLLSA